MKRALGWTMWMRMGVIGLVCAITCPAWAMEPIQISMAKKTDSRSQVKARAAPKGKAWTQSSRQLYRIELRRVMPGAPEDVVVQWLLVKEMPNGRLIPAVDGRTNMTLDLGKPASFETDAVDCGTVDIIRPLGKGAPVRREERLHGCIVRVYDTAGELLTEKYMPTSLAKEAEALMKSAGVRPPR
jgi:hypothetical protein